MREHGQGILKKSSEIQSYQSIRKLKHKLEFTLKIQYLNTEWPLSRYTLCSY